ncbi:pilus assembly protein TadE [Qipengyuania sp. NPDC077563]|uniref:pilus assembly protein TadE n=1 Tax=Qipengyuania sp. NPDC077563 TaxID=3364497 RepID=UPI0038512E82
MVGFEIANLAVTKTRVSQIALSVADNASRLGQTDNTALAPTISENEVNAVLRGAEEQGKSISFAENGRVILSSLEYDDVLDRQFIHWQRCYGDKDVESAYGNDSDKNGKSGPRLNGMGEVGREVTAPSGEAVMFVEVYYEYPAVFSNSLTRDITFREEAAFIIRDDRTLTPVDDPNEKGLTGALLNEC